MNIISGYLNNEIRIYNIKNLTRYIKCGKFEASREAAPLYSLGSTEPRFFERSRRKTFSGYFELDIPHELDINKVIKSFNEAEKIEFLYANYIGYSRYIIKGMDVIEWNLIYDCEPYVKKIKMNFIAKEIITSRND